MTNIFVWLFLRRMFIPSWLFLHPPHISQEYLWTLERNIDDDTVMSLSSLTMTVPGPGPGVSRSHHQLVIFIFKNILQPRVTSMSVPTVSLSRAGPQGSPRHSVDRWAVSSQISMGHYILKVYYYIIIYSSFSLSVRAKARGIKG